MLYTAPLLEQMKLHQLAKPSVGTTNHLKFQNKYMLISKNMLQTVAHQLSSLTKLAADYKEAHPELAAEVEAIIDGRDPVEVTPADFPALENGFLKQLVIQVKMP